MVCRSPLPLLFAFALLGASAAWAFQPAKPPAYPATKAEPLVEKLHGQDVADPYRWLEKQTDPAVLKWIAAQNAFTRGVLDGLPGRQKIARRFDQLLQIGALPAPPQLAKGKLAYLRRAGDQDQPVLFVRDGIQGRDRALINPNVSDPTGLTSLDWFHLSPNGRYVAFGLSTGGTELSTLQVADLSAWKLLPDKIDRTRACSLAWTPDGAGFYYTRYPDPKSVPAGEDSYHRHVYFHKLGSDPSKDEKVFGAGRPKEDWCNVALSPSGKWLLITIEQGWSKTELHLKDTAAAEPAKSLGCGNAIHQAVMDDEHLYVRTNDGAPRFKVMKAAFAKPERADWQELIPEHADSLDEAARVGKRLVLHYLKDATSRLAFTDLAGKEQPGVSVPPLGSVSGLGGEPDGNDLFISYTNYLTPTTIYHADLDRAQVELWQRLAVPGFDPDDFQVEQFKYTSKDGKTMPTLFIVHKRGVKKDKRNPTLLYGYGGFAVSETPRFRADFIQFIENGGVAAVANLRGGSEFGEAWHQDGMLGKKQNVFDDFIAAAEWLVSLGYTSPEKLAIEGGSNGGLLVAAAATQKPELFRAVVCQVPLTDMLRYHKFGIGRLWIPEYGDPDQAEAFGWLAKYSPYHAVKPQTKYPAMLITAAAGDSRVDPLHACKLAARLQAASAGDRPILLRLESQAGHGAGKSRRQAVLEQTDVWSFLYNELGVAP